MNKLTSNLVKDYKPMLALMVYATDDKFDECYLESHAVNADGAILAGKPLKQETIEAVVDVFFDQQQNRSKISGFIPSSLLQFINMPGGYYKMVWYTPAQRRFLHFADDLKISSGEAWVPPMIWVAKRKELNVYALATDKRPVPETPVFMAPFHNVDDEGSVCLGSARVVKPTEKTYLATMQYWEDMFFKSVFTHLHSDCPTKTNINMLWRRLIKDSTIKWSKLDELKRMDNNLNDLL